MYVCYVCMLCMHVMYACYVCICIAVQSGSTSIIEGWFHKFYSKLRLINLQTLGLQTFLKMGFMSVTQNWFHKCYSKFIPQVLLQIEPNFTQNWFHECYSTLVPQMLLKIGSTSGAKLENLLACNFFYRLKY